MDHMLYLSMTGTQHIMLAQQNNSHNLANANTVGFKADLDAFRSLPVYGPGHPTRAYVENSQYGYDFSGGGLMHTGRDLDVAIADQGWIAVQVDDGSEAYTRRGDLRVDQTGLLRNGAGDLVLGSGGPISIPPHETLVVGRDGTVSILPLGQSAATLAAVDRIRLVAPALEALNKGDDGLFRLPPGQLAQPDASVTLFGGALESSNVNTVDALVQMIELARAFESQVKLMEVTERNDEASASVMGIS
ncbi:MAG: flagellar basal body rod protein FlgF [Gammaproteobacteria bacterium]|nr:flagellar basal body rod protein FlgF [Gammaproteobacteria bacterium]